jgi:hypothetical protein
MNRLAGLTSVIISITTIIFCIACIAFSIEWIGEVQLVRKLLVRLKRHKTHIHNVSEREECTLP